MLLQRNGAADHGSGSSGGFFDDYLKELQNESGGSDNGIGSFMVAFRLSGMAKVKGVCEFIETLFENGAKFLVFAHHQAVLDDI